MAACRARRVRGSRRRLSRSPPAILNGVRNRKVARAITPIASPGRLGATANPRTTGSRVSPHPPCSEGMTTPRSRGVGGEVMATHSCRSTAHWPYRSLANPFMIREGGKPCDEFSSS